MFFRKLWTAVKEGFIGFFRHLGTAVSAIVSNACVFIVLGVIIIMILSANNLTGDMRDRANKMVIFLEKDLTPFQQKNLEERLKGMPEIKSLTFISKEQAIEDFKRSMEEDAYLFDNLKSNPFQDSYEIELTDISMADSLAEKLKLMSEIESANFHEEIMGTLSDVTKYTRMGGMVLIFVLIIISVVIMSNITRIAMASRRKEINIMKYVGASNEFIKGPFVVEAMITGLLSAGLAVLVIEICYYLFYNHADLSLYALLEDYLVTPAFLLKDITAIFVTLGLGVGAIGSILSSRKYLNV